MVCGSLSSPSVNLSLGKECKEKKPPCSLWDFNTFCFMVHHGFCHESHGRFNVSHDVYNASHDNNVSYTMFYESIGMCNEPQIL